MKKIPLTQNQFALVDDEDYEYIRQWEWYAYRNKNECTWYAGRNSGKSPHQRRIQMHRAIINVPSNVVVDHWDRNGLNNQKYNLRPCTKAQNRQNSKKRTNNTSGYIGVTWRSDSKTWKSQIRVNGILISKSGFSDVKDAARYYNEMASFYFGDFAVLNGDL